MKFFVQDKGSSYFSPLQQPYLVPSPTKPNGVFEFNDKISPGVLLIIIILAIIFFVSGLLHLLVRFLLRPGNRDPNDFDNVTVLQGQLQQLFHLHDSGVDQSFIDTLPIFNYKAIIGLKNPFDCAVCLCEFEPDDKLRLLPKCSHAFHMECIDTWLLSHSTCPLCRGNLLLEFSQNNGMSMSPIVLVLESNSESSREIESETRNAISRSNSILNTDSHLGIDGDNDNDNDLGSSRFEISPKSCEILAKVESLRGVDKGEKVVCVKLGKYRNVDMGEGSSYSNGIDIVDDGRRCFSMGYFEYVMDENSSLQVAIRTPFKKQSSKKPTFPVTPVHRQAMSECDCESRRGFNAFDVVTNGNGNGNFMCRSKRDSFSISKIWLRGEKGKKAMEECSRRTFSFRFPRENGNGIDEENESCNGKTPSFARRTLHWLVGRQNKVVHSSFTPTYV